MRLGEFAAQPGEVFLALGRVLGVEDAVVAAGEIVRDPLAHFAAGPDHGHSGLGFGHDLLLK